MHDSDACVANHGGAFCGGKLNEFAHRLVAVDEEMRAAGEILNLGRGQVDAHVVIEGREDFLEMNGTIDRFAAETIGAADELAGFHIAAGQERA